MFYNSNKYVFLCIMATKKKESQNFLSFIERGVALVFVVLFLFWFARRCARSAQMRPQQPISKTQNLDTIKRIEEIKPIANNTANRTTTICDTIVKTVVIPPMVYVYVEGLKLREEPYLNKTVLAELTINTTLTYLNEKTPFAQKITLDNVTYNEPWLKVQTSDNLSGWVYGGGVRFYKK